MGIKIAMLVVFFAVMVGIGMYCRRHATDVKGFVLGGRNVGPWLTAFAYGTSYFSAVIFVGYAGQFGWKYGVASTWIGIGNALIGSLLAWAVLGRRTRIMTQHLNAATMPEFFGKRFSSKALKIGASLIVFIFLIPYTASLYNGLSRLFAMAFSVDYTICIVIMALFTGIYVIAGGYMCFKGELTLGSLVAFSTLLTQTLSPLMRASSMFFNLRYAAAAADRVFSIINEPSEPEGDAVLTKLPDGAPAVSFKNVSFGYEEDKPVLKGIALDIRKGETVGFAGASGCGKSTLLGLVCGFYRPTGGKILIGGVDLNDSSLKSTRGLISYVSQEAYLFPISIYDNIAMGKENATREEVIAAAKAAYAHDFITETENGYDTVVGERGCRLSGGQIQRISIARAMLKNAPILLLDEATSALDVKAEAEVQKALDNLSDGKTVLVVAHRLSTIMNADRIAVVQDGVICECGTHDELMKRGGAYAALQNKGNA